MIDKTGSLSSPFTTAIAVSYLETHARVLQMANELSDEQLAWRPPGSASSIGFNLWHLARWADHLQATIPGMTTVLSRRLEPGLQLWEVEGLAAQWDFDVATLGFAETGMLMDTDAAARLSLPPKELLLDYVRRAFAAAEKAVSVVDDAQWLELEQEQFEEQDRTKLGPKATVGGAILAHLVHDNRHLGMMECLRGLQTISGSVTS